jgi:hypothetical protein
MNTLLKLGAQVTDILIPMRSTAHSDDLATAKTETILITVARLGHHNPATFRFPLPLEKERNRTSKLIAVL